MKRHLLSLALLWISLIGTTMVQGVAAADTNVITTASRYSIVDTIDRLEQAVVAKGMHLFARIDHGEEATKAGLERKPTILLIFGNSKGGQS